jgi:hypothetical protein
MNKLKVVFVTIFTAALLVACARPAEPPAATPLPEYSPLPTPPVSPISPLPPPPLAADETAEAALLTLRTEVAGQLGLTEQALTLISTEQVTWSDASLGCPQPDMAYAQVLTPGWRIVFADAEGRQHSVHTTENYTFFVICASPARSGEDSAEHANPAIAAAIEMLAKQENLAAASVNVVSVAAIEWPNSCLGCATPGQNCLTVLTPGYRIVLASGAETYVFHTDRTGTQVIRCTQPGLTPSGEDS